MHLNAGYALFKVLDEGKLKDVENIWKEFESPAKANALLQLQGFQAFKGTKDALAATTALIDGTSIDKGLKKFLKKQIVKKGLSDKLGVMDVKLGGLIKDKLSIKCVHNDKVHELLRGVRSQMANLVTELSEKDTKTMALGLSHSLSRYKLKFSPDKVDTMIVQAIGLLDELDKELNTYTMRAKEWYGWHFPELAKLVNDNVCYIKIVVAMGMRKNAVNTDFSAILEDETVASDVQSGAVVSMGTDISEDDMKNILFLCNQVLSMMEYRTQLFEYLKARMAAIAPNLTILVGELVGARLIAHAGSLLNLAKAPASTVQILGAEKALFRALKTNSETPKYGLIYHASLIGQAAPKNKGKISRVLAAKAALAVRVDALGDEEGATIGYTARAKVEARLRELEGGAASGSSGAAQARSRTTAPAASSSSASFNTASDVTSSKKRKMSEDAEETEEPAKKKEKKEKKDKKEKKAKKKRKAAEEAAPVEEEEASPKKKKKKKKKKE